MHRGQKQGIQKVKFGGAVGKKQLFQKFIIEVVYCIIGISEKKTSEKHEKVDKNRVE